MITILQSTNSLLLQRNTPLRRHQVIDAGRLVFESKGLTEAEAVFVEMGGVVVNVDKPMPAPTSKGERRQERMQGGQRV